MRGMQQQLGNWGTISAFAYRQRETKKNLCRDGKMELEFHPDSAWKRSSKTCIKLTNAERTVENS